MTVLSPQFRFSFSIKRALTLSIHRLLLSLRNKTHRSLSLAPCLPPPPLLNKSIRL
ncbi:uncharacterized protein G2W53_030518 [Senna tora]|uniref:Uncharacterized protein n=1 Tax=Senna tora TaxID=362788 RepID=A0A834T6K1_9FABA|nr:uncharacterized protein G2W53_030518 [Senna tora]